MGPGVSPDRASTRSRSCPAATVRWRVFAVVMPGRAPCRAVSVGVQAGGDGGRCGGGRGVPGPGLRGWCACAVTTTAAAAVGAAVESAAVVWGAVGAAGRAVRCPGSSRSRSRRRSRFGCAGRGGVCRWGGFAECQGCCCRSLGVAVLGVCRCGRVHVRCHLLPVLRAAACCRLPFVNCRLRTVDWGQWAFPVCPSCVCCRFGVCASFGALPPVGVIPSGRSPAPRFRVRHCCFLGLGASPDSTWGIPCEPRAETGPSYGRVVSDPASGASRPEAWLSLLAPTRLLYGIHIPVRTPIIHHPRNTRITHKTRNRSCSTPNRLHPNRNQTRKPPTRARQSPTPPSLPARTPTEHRPGPSYTPQATPTPPSPPALTGSHLSRVRAPAPSRPSRFRRCLHEPQANRRTGPATPPGKAHHRSAAAALSASHPPPHSRPHLNHTAPARQARRHWH